MTYDVVVIGAGVVGSLTARELTRYRLKVCLLESEADVAMGASKANSAIVHGGYDPVPGTLKAKLNVQGTVMMQGVCDDLDVGYRNNGSMVVAFSEEQIEHVKMLKERGEKNGVKGLSVITGDEARKLEPQLSDAVVGALLCTSSGIVCPYNLAVAATGNAMDNGADLKLNFKVTGIEDKGEKYVLTSSNGEKVESRYIVNAAGLGSDAIAMLLGDNKWHLTAKKGEYMLLDKADGKMVDRTIFQTPTKAGKGILVTPTVDGNLLTGPTSEKCEKGDKSTTLKGLDTIKSTAALSVPKVDFRDVITSFSGLRASCDESEDFVIELSEKSNRTVHAVGIDSPGLSASPAIAVYIVELLKNAGLKLDVNDKFNPKRVSCSHFRHLSNEEKNEWIKKEPAYGRIICRCENVTEGEILAAIRQNPKATTLDAVKRRTRAGMGRCQAGFCTPFTTGLIAKELGIEETKVTKFGKGSELLVGDRK
jgi:glycerol-3-phosphate dehydrogenase